MSRAHTNAAVASRRLTEFRVPEQHHAVKVSVRDYKRSSDLAHRHGAKLVTGTGRHMVAHFDNKSKASQFHRAMQASGHHDAALHSVRESCPTEK